MKHGCHPLAVSLLSLCAPLAWAQSGAFAVPGSRLRLTTAPAPATANDTTVRVPEEGGILVGTLVGADDDTLTLRLDPTGRSLQVPRLSIRTVEVSTGKRSRRRTGAIVGAAAGAFLMYATDDPCPESETDCSLDSHVGERLGAAALGALVYGFVGWGIGSLFKTDRWSPAALEDIRVSLAPTRGRGVALSLSVAF